MKLFRWIFIFYFILMGNVYADIVINNKFKYPFYFGLTGGYGWTTWQGLVPPPNKRNLAMALSTPDSVTEGGALWGLFAGFELLPSFALETAYTHYPNAKITFSSDSIFTFKHGFTDFISKTEIISIMAKIMMFIPCTDMRVYSSLGLAEVHRNDDVNNHWKASPTFGVGFNYNFTDHVMGELGADYTAGRGQSELNPAESYYPFLYSVFLRLAYRL